MSVWEFIIAFAVAAGICTAIMLIANLIYEAYEKRKFRRECEKMFDFYDFYFVGFSIIRSIFFKFLLILFQSVEFLHG